MDFSNAISIIRKDLEEARSFLDELATTPGIPVAELELARSRVRSAIEMLAVLPKLKEKSGTEAETPTEKIPPGEQEKHPAGEKKISEEPQPTHKKEMADHTNQEKVKTDTPRNKNQEQAKTILADKFSGANCIGEQITGSKQDEVIASVMSLKAIDDISTAIGINDKFYFIRELFSGDSKAYQDTIRRLNASASLGEAMKILDDSTIMGSDPAAQSAFVDIVRRKFNLDV